MKRINFLGVVLLIVLGITTNLAIAQDAKDKKLVKKLAKEACGCTEKINANLGKEEVLEKVNECITVAIMKEQMSSLTKEMKDLERLLKDAKLTVKEGDTTVVVDKKVDKTIYANKNFREIQDYMMEKCSGMKTLIKSDDMLSEKSLSANPKAMKLYSEAHDYFDKKKFEKAVETYKKALALDPEFAFAWDNLGLTYRHMGNYDEAIKCYRKSLEIDPYGTMPLQNIATAYEFKKEYALAAEAYEKLINIDSANPEGYYGAARAFYFAGDYEKGCDNIFKAYKIYSETKSPYLKDAESVLGAFYQDLKEKGKLQILEDAAKKNNIQLN